MNKNPQIYSKDDFFTAVLNGIDAPASDTNLFFLKEWARHEGGSATFNPLNTTEVMHSGETNYNSAGVKNYPDFLTGVNATVKTLKLHYYTAIVEALKKEFPTWTGNNDIIAALKIWGTRNYANELA